jgi:hypothetical protein
VDVLSFDSILELEASWLEGDFGEKEVRKVFFSYGWGQVVGP